MSGNEIRPRVFVVQETPVNFTPASEYGDLVFLLPGDANLMFVPQPSIRRLRDGLRSFLPHDFLLPTGDPVAIGVAFTIVNSKTDGRLNILKWDRQERRYYHVVLDLKDRTVLPKEVAT